MQGTNLDFLFKGFWTGMEYVSRYAIPLEDAIILIDGRDFDEEQSSRVAAGAFIVLDIIQIGKVMKIVKAGVKATTTTAKIIRKPFIDYTKEVGKEALIEFSVQLTVNFLIEAYQPTNKGVEASVLLKKAYDRIDWQDIAMATTQGIKLKSKITDEQINCIYSLYRNFQNEEAGNYKKILSFGADCLLSSIVTYGYDNIKKRRLFREIGKAL